MTQIDNSRKKGDDEEPDGPLMVFLEFKMDMTGPYNVLGFQGSMAKSVLNPSIFQTLNIKRPFELIKQITLDDLTTSTAPKAAELNLCGS